MNDLQDRLANLTEAERWRLIRLLAREHPDVVARAMAHVRRDPRRVTVVPGQVIASRYHPRTSDGGAA